MDLASENKIEKKLKRKEFNIFDSAIASCVFIVLQLLFSFIITVLPVQVKSTFTVAFIISFLVEAVFFFTVIITSYNRKVEFVEATKMNVKPDILSILLAVAISLICLFCFTGLTNTFVNVLYKLGYSSDASIVVPNALVYVIYIFLICICPAFFEDLLFRGCILSGLRGLGDKKAVILSALIFMLMHGGPDQTIHQFVIGIVLGSAFIASNSIWIPVIIHFVNNFVALTGAYLTRNLPVAEIEILSWGQIFLQFAYAVITAIVGVYLVYFCIVGLKELRKNKENKNNKNKENAGVIEDKQVEIEEQNETASVNIREENKEVNLEIKNEKKKTIIAFTLAGVYLVIDWILALVMGLL